MTDRTKKRTAFTIGVALAAAVGATGLTPLAPAAAVPRDPGADDVVFTLGTRDGRIARPEGIALGGGRLSAIGWADPERWRGLYEYDLPASGTPTPGPRRTVDEHFWTQWPCGGQTEELCDHFESRLWALGDGRIGYNSPMGNQEAAGGEMPKSSTQLGWWESPDLVAGASGPYVIVNNTRRGQQLIGSFDASDRDPQGDSPGLAHARSITASAVWGDKLWKPGTRLGTVNSFDLRTKVNSADIALGADCRPDELQAVGRWLYWRCADKNKSGIWDHSTRRNIPLPVVWRAQLGDGFIVWQPQEGYRLKMIDFHRGGGSPTTETVIADQSHLWSWTVDKYGGQVAFVDEAGRIHLTPIKVPRSPIAALDARTDASLRLGGSPSARWSGHWRLSRPAEHWNLTLTSPYGRVVQTIGGSARDGAAIRTTWDGRDVDGRPVISGPYTWTLSVTPGDGPPLRAISSGTVRVTGGRTAFRDGDADGLGEFYAMTKAGRLSAHRIGATGSWSSGPWDPATRFIPFGDIDGDGCEDMLRRTVDGAMWRTGGGCEGHFTPGSRQVRIGTGFNAFDSFAAPGDLTADGRPDLLARQTSTGHLFLYAATPTARFAAPVRVGTGWRGLTLIGAGDLTGDGHGDLLARDTGGELWRYAGDGRGGLKPRALVFKDWGAGRKEILGTGDLTGDGRPDLLSRDTTGKLLRNAGDGKGSFGGTVRVGTGWAAYRALY
ncbi:FG-GAP-like repeat-containing protein [Streptomyces sp. NPDC020965]|uniref:FG-GAP-like repeat-containing protein n=1 Tax=Streptomyces sp. NPDC020965 TaxID=3365105 RepID=UPI003788EA1D